MATFETYVLAGGLSTRMGQDKARVRIGGRTMLAYVRSTAQAAGYDVHVLRKDSVPRCGPLGGILTALRKSKVDAVLFLACDMPLIRPEVLHRLVKASSDGRKAAFAATLNGVGFPLLIPRACLAEVEQQRTSASYSLQKLADRLNARQVRMRAEEAFNANSPEDLVKMRELMSRRIAR
jgi:molybdenum cofactor guanylyltransferase